mmetsp:Transcript_26645/g.86271  ORF Transcript_26645/g.86271 Transcript_26645/m.86271 type:complete len:276 (-) Transcript_26645:1296-2123(-)
MPAESPVTWYLEMPPVSRLYLTGSFLTTALCALDVVSPFSLYYDSALIFQRWELWRLVSNFLFFGLFSLDFLFHMYFLVRYCRLLEEGEFRGKPWEFASMLFFGAAAMLCVAPFLSIHFLGSSLTFMMVYVWGRRNEHVRMSFLGLFPFNAPYLPWVMLAFSVLLGNPATTDVIGIAVGHLYFYFHFVYPAIADIRGWSLLRPPRTLLDDLRTSLFGAPPRSASASAGSPRNTANTTATAAAAERENHDDDDDDDDLDNDGRPDIPRPLFAEHQQ